MGNGQILDPNGKFGSYGIKDGDELYLGIRGKRKLNPSILPSPFPSTSNYYFTWNEVKQNNYLF